MATCLLAIGSNLGDRQATLDSAVLAIDECVGIQFIQKSHWHRSAPVGGPPDQGEFFNGAVTIETKLAPEPLLESLRRIEDRFGRERTVHWGPRTLDIDLLLIDDQIITTERLTVPHPEMVNRRFVLEPAVEIAGDWVHPQLAKTVQQLLDELDDTPPTVVE